MEDKETLTEDKDLVAYISVASSQIKEILRIEEKILDERLNFITWIVGIASGGFLLFFTKLKELREVAGPQSDVIQISFRGIVGCYIVVILASILFRILSQQELLSIVVELAAVNAQEAYLKSKAHTLILDWKNEEVDKGDYNKILSGFLRRRFLPKDMIDHYIAAKNKHRKYTNWSNGLHWIALGAFIGKQAFIVFTFWKLFCL